MNYSARCLVDNAEMGTLVGLPSPTSYAKTASLRRGDGISLLHLLEPPTLEPGVHILVCETNGKPWQLLTAPADLTHKGTCTQEITSYCCLCKGLKG